MLLLHGGDVNATDYDNRSPLYYAAYNGNEDCLKTILRDKRLDINITRNGGWTPLHETSRFGHLSCTKALLRYDLVKVFIFEN